MDQFSSSIDPVRRSTSEIIPFLKHVGIDEEKINELAIEVIQEGLSLPEWRAPVFPNEEEEGYSDVIEFLFVGNAINFQFRSPISGEKYAVEYLDSTWKGAFGMWASLKRAYDRNIPILSADFLEKLSLKQANDIFHSDLGEQIPMLEDRVDILNQVGSVLNERYSGSFTNLIEQADNCLYSPTKSGIVDLLVRDFHSFDDRAKICTKDRERTVYFYKRAQLAPAMAYGRFQGTDEFRITDPEAFTVFADYNLPNVLRSYNVLSYSQPLSQAIEAGEFLQPNERMEVELRSSTIHAASLLQEEINKKISGEIFGPHVDYALFKLRDGVESPVHKSKTVNY